jgi:hypothetical protein
VGEHFLVAFLAKPNEPLAIEHRGGAFAQFLARPAKFQRIHPAANVVAHFTELLDLYY